MVWVIASAVMLATFMEALDTSIVAVSLPLYCQRLVGIQQRSYLLNLLRDVGGSGSIGISVVNTLLLRRAQVHRSELAHSVSHGIPEFKQRLQAIARALATHPDPVTAMRRATKLLELTFMQQRLMSTISATWRFCVSPVLPLHLCGSEGEAHRGWSHGRALKNSRFSKLVHDTDRELRTVLS
jgi:hypothetical protein